MFGYILKRFPLRFLESLGFNNFWLNVLLWPLARLAMLELKIKYGSLQNYLDHCDSKRNS